MTTKVQTKSVVAQKLIARMLGHKKVYAPKDIKEALATKLECSARMASTYYYNVTSPNGRWNPEVQAAKVAASAES